MLLSRLVLAQTEHTSPSVRFWHILQQHTFFLASKIAFAKLSPSPSGSERTWNASLCALLRPIPGRDANLSIRFSMKISAYLGFFIQYYICYLSGFQVKQGKTAFILSPISVYAFLIASICAFLSGFPKTALPATRTVAPASFTSFAVTGSTPPSTSSSQARPLLSISCLSSAILGS